MKLETFGSILRFAAQMESEDRAFYESVLRVNAAVASGELFKKFIENAKKNEKTLGRVRQENITEMILEQIRHFDSESFTVEIENIESMDPGELLGEACRLEKRAEAFYREAAEKLNKQKEVSRALTLLAKKRKQNHAALTMLDPVS